MTPNLERFPTHLKSQEQNFKRRFAEWLLTEKHFLGRVWRVVHLEPYKSSRKFEEKTQRPSYRVILFAVSGYDIPPALHRSVEEVINWFLPLQKNEKQPYCKVFARLDLGFSKTEPTIAFKPSQVKRVADIYADGTPEATEFDDPRCDWTASRIFNRAVNTSMNDGCAKISLGACRLIREKMCLSGPIPSAFQARIGGAKGVWIRSAEWDTKSENDQDIWIEINDSQLKFFPHDEDLDDERYDPLRLTFEVNQYAQCPSPSSLYLAFIPILQDRGVSQLDIQSLMNKVLYAERELVLSAVQDPVRCRAWMHKNFSSSEERLRVGGMIWQAGLPLSNTEKINFLLESGFVPAQSTYLGISLQEAIETYYTRLVQSLRIRLNRSTMVMGISDPTKTLRPGEIHLAFSQAFVDEDSGSFDFFLHEREVLVARHPALRRSDIQKVRAIHSHKLAHIVDVVVFPSRGCVPLAHKLQGGDYDGDTFWICWEEALVKDFRNAPIPHDVPSPHQFGIKVDRQTLGEVRDCLLSMDTFLSKCFHFRVQADLLGQCTNLHESLAYSENSINSAGVNFLASLHGYLIDSAKNGYIFSEDRFRDLVKSISGRIYTTKMPTPAYKEVMKVGFRGAIDKFGESTVKDRSREMTIRPKLNHIVDFLFFTVVQPSIFHTFECLNSYFAEAITIPDKQLEYICCAQQDEDPDIQAKFKSLEEHIGVIEKVWMNKFPNPAAPSTMRKSKGPEASNLVIQEIFSKFSSYVPKNTTHPKISSWTIRRLPQEPDSWSLYKASKLYSILGQKRNRLVFRIAGRELGYIKALSNGNVRHMIEQMWAQLKPGKPKTVGESIGFQVASSLDVAGDKVDDDGNCTNQIVLKGVMEGWI
jgi:hypothetical protein